MYQNKWRLERVRLVVSSRPIDLSPWLVLVSMHGSYVLQAVSCKKKAVSAGTRITWILLEWLHRGDEELVSVPSYGHFFVAAKTAA